MQDHPVVAVTGLAFEARIAAGPNTFVICSGDGSRLEASLEEAVASGCRGLISFGIAGGLSSDLTAGTWVVASGVIEGRTRYAADPLWSEMILRSHPGAIHGAIAGVDAAVSEPSAKLALKAKTGAIIVDMESHRVARVAHAHGIPFAAFRVVADPSHRRLPKAALNATLADGSSDVVAVLRSLARSPIQLPDLMRTAFDTRKARAALVSSRRSLGASFCFPVAGERLSELPHVGAVMAAE